MYFSFVYISLYRISYILLYTSYVSYINFKSCMYPILRVLYIRTKFGHCFRPGPLGLLVGQARNKFVFLARFVPA